MVELERALLALVTKMMKMTTVVKIPTSDSPSEALPSFLACCGFDLAAPLAVTTYNVYRAHAGDVTDRGLYGTVNTVK